MLARCNAHKIDFYRFKDWAAFNLFIGKSPVAALDLQNIAGNRSPNSTSGEHYIGKKNISKKSFWFVFRCCGALLSLYLEGYE